MISKKDLVPAALLSPSLLLLVAIIFLPTVWTLYLSFTRFSPGGSPEFVGFENYARTLRTPEFWNALFNNLMLIGVVIVAQLLFAVALALLLERPRRFNKILVMLAIAPYAVSPVSSVVVWKNMFNPYYGIINYLTVTVGLERVMWLTTPASAFLAIVITMMWKGYTFQFLLAYSALLSIPTDIIDSATVDGATGFHLFRYVKLPMMMPAIMVGLVFQIVFGLRIFDIPWVFTEGGPGRSTEILSMYLYRTAYRYFRFGEASAVAWLMLLITFAIAARLIWNVYKSKGVMN